MYMKSEILDGLKLDDKRMFVALKQNDDGGGIFIIGIYGNYLKAMGRVMEDIWEFQDSYKDKDDEFKISAPYELEGEAGYGVSVTYKAACWKEARKDYYFVLGWNLKSALEELMKEAGCCGHH